jgi:hypothetical protein
MASTAAAIGEKTGGTTGMTGEMTVGIVVSEPSGG